MQLPEGHLGALWFLPGLFAWLGPGYLLYISRLKSWKRVSLFLSINPSTEYLKQRPKFQCLEHILRVLCLRGGFNR